jgi:hypothetical protein
VAGTYPVFVSKNQNYYYRVGYYDRDFINNEEICYSHDPLLIDSTLYFWANQKYSGLDYDNIDLRFHYDLYSLNGRKITKHSNINSRKGLWEYSTYFNQFHKTVVANQKAYFRTNPSDPEILSDNGAYISEINLAGSNNPITQVMRGFTDKNGIFYETGLYSPLYAEGKFYYYGFVKKANPNGTFKTKIIGLFSHDIESGKTSLLDVVQQIDSMKFQTEYGSKIKGSTNELKDFYTIGRQDIYYQDSMIIYQKDGYVEYADTFTFKGLRYYYINLRDTVDTSVNTQNQYVSESNRFKVYPNPSSHSFYVLGDKTNVEAITVWNTNGALVKQLNVQDIEYTMDDLPKGMYLIQIQDKKGLQKLKWIKQ